MADFVAKLGGRRLVRNNRIGGKQVFESMLRINRRS